MSSTYSTNLAIELIGTGDQAGVWGNTTNTNLGTLIEQAISGYVTQAVATGTDTTITIPNGATGVARNMYIELTGTGGASTNLIVPANKKLYFIFNNSTGAVTVKVLGQTGVSVPQGKKMVLVCNGTDIVNGLNYIADFGTNSFTVTNLTATSATITTLTATSSNITTLTSGSATITNLLGTTLTISGNSFLATSSGNVGIGTASPAVKLEVLRGSEGEYLRAGGDDTGNNGRGLRFTSSTNGGFIGAKHTLNAPSAGGAIAFATASTERAVIDASGNLGLGVTPSAWSGGFRAMQLPGGSVASFASGTNLQIEVGNAYYQSSLGTYNYFNTGTAPTIYRQFSGSHNWYTAPSGTAGNAISFTQAMTLTAAGDLALGATATSGNGERLYVTNAQNNVAIFKGTGGGLAQILAWNDANKGVGMGAYASTYSGGSNFSVGANGAYVAAGNGAPFAVGTTDAQPLLLGTNNAERARITSGGDFGIGTTSPAYKLDVNGDGRISGNSYFGVHDGSDKYYFERFSAGLNAYLVSGAADNNASQGFVFQCRNSNGVEYNAFAIDGYSSTSTVLAMMLDSSGNLGIGTSSPTVKLEVNGQIRTEAPTGGTAANWRLGTVHTVSPTSPNRTIEVDIGGTIYYLHAKTTNN